MRAKLAGLISTVLGYPKRSSLSRRLLSGGIWAFGGKVGVTALSVITNGLLARMLSPREFGTYFLVFSIIQVGAVIGAFGLPKTIVRFVAENMVHEQPGRVRRVIRTALGLGALGSLGVGLVYLLIVGDLIGKHLFHSPLLVAITGL